MLQVTYWRFWSHLKLFLNKIFLSAACEDIPLL